MKFLVMQFPPIPHHFTSLGSKFTFVDTFLISAVHFSITDLGSETILGIEYNFQSSQIM
jgi:hypothetical protein